MDQEKQRQITIYFIEEAKEHLDTIEHGLLNMESMISDPESVNELFRAAHSIKGGAAMLGYTSIQTLAHNIEDHFKVFKDNNKLKVDQQLQTMFLEGFDKLKDLINHLESPQGLNLDVADRIVRASEPVFDQLRRYLNSLTGAKPETLPAPKAVSLVPAPATPTPQGDRTLINAFQVDVPNKLRDMLQCFKQPDSPKNRDNLQAICTQLKDLGDRFNLPQWSELLLAMHSVLGNLNLQFRLLAPLAIREIKQAQELVLAGKATSIKISAQVKEALPPGVLIGEELRTEQWQAFVAQLNWHTPQQVLYDSEAVFGHLPAPIWFGSWQELRPSYEAFLQKLGDCQIN